MIKKIDLLIEIKTELKRFAEKLDIAIKEQHELPKGKYLYQSKKYASAKRAALDLKNELTKLTQDSKYLRNQDND